MDRISRATQIQVVQSKDPMNTEDEKVDVSYGVVKHKKAQNLKKKVRVRLRYHGFCLSVTSTTEVRVQLRYHSFSVPSDGYCVSRSVSIAASVSQVVCSEDHGWPLSGVAVAIQPPFSVRRVDDDGLRTVRVQLINVEEHQNVRCLPIEASGTEATEELNWNSSLWLQLNHLLGVPFPRLIEEIAPHAGCAVALKSQIEALDIVKWLWKPVTMIFAVD
ncbi:hypothetical protein RHMOL_Rhmol13G0220500 [Rhododendron molle]|uniref:Uncharacterized protein n=6 Tax=Rhododendron molle TaxID=49168 RepID=A0ACC0L9S4_RHOML|nr:hypothetical protein RHMOL_Rhmol13G0220500 [Rhododendron molle]KAI8525305.1 hypothetical protein RHMOL_Rhmol13G0220500 [Rhododendron molle]KAI8525306.1 hypothetical protein RHMOL_Rhmol13G0220500 [Rhododendron molle]KAI8525307.1 hypothetical protein RHMOL_Rhmol13G0220500 [Rhododendron molle]KAI8525308.1 hypothetical protein RHMOL_Rhmol13G0220500 [Rhododendron molle]